MANFQNAVRLAPAIGIPGAYASVNPIVTPALGRLAKTNVNIGAFVWDATDEGYVQDSGSGKPLGFVCHDAMYVYPTNDVGNYVPAGECASVQTRGDFYVQVGASVTKGQKVFAKTTDGTVVGGNAGASVSSAVETDWVFATSAGANEIAIISHL